MKTFKTFLREQAEQKLQDSQKDYVTPLYRALISAEHRGVVKDPTKFDPKLHIRTKYQPKGDVSTAYGPAQLTVSTLEDMMKRYPSHFTSDIKDYANAFIAQGKKMLAADPKDPKYGYGCKGDLCDPKHQESYEKLATAVLKGKLADAKIDFNKPIEGESLTKAIRYWRGVGETDTVTKKGKTLKGDPEYFKVVRERLPEFSGGQAPIQPTPPPVQTTKPEPIKQEHYVDNRYTVQSGDSLSKIAQQNKTTVEELAKLNNITDVNKIKTGEKIKLPKS